MFRPGAGAVKLLAAMTECGLYLLVIDHLRRPGSAYLDDTAGQAASKLTVVEAVSPEPETVAPLSGCPLSLQVASCHDDSRRLVSRSAGLDALLGRRGLG